LHLDAVMAKDEIAKVIDQLFPLIHRHKENKAIQRSLKISFRELLTKLQYYGSIN
jgi:hypothetical protein